MEIEPSDRDKTRTWAYGIKEPGWYCARGKWDESCSEHLRSLGYTVERSEEKPNGKPAA